MADGAGMGLGFTLTLTMLGAIREFLTSGSVFDIKLIPGWTTDFLLAGAAPGAFIIVGCILAVKNYMNRRAAIRAGRLYVPPQGLNCRNCGICRISDDK
jgi:electron transport complex protein RnfE